MVIGLVALGAFFLGNAASEHAFNPADTKEEKRRQVRGSLLLAAIFFTFATAWAFLK
jgi:hypothetical protein